MTAALVTGGTRGLGRAIALRLARAGMDLVLVSRQRDVAVQESLTLLANEGVRALHVAADCSKEDDVAAAFSAAADAFGAVDVVVHAAGVRNLTLLADMSVAQWREVIANNLDAAFLCSRAALAHVPAAGGRIVFITGTVGAIGRTGRAHLAAAKAGMEGLARSLALELADRKITVNCVSPGVMDAGAPDGAAAAAELKIPAGRLGLPAEVAAAVALLVSAEGAYTTGQVLHVNGGLYFG
jgi:3-oxoacyl-[acyl-carrier protein] reductase